MSPEQRARANTNRLVAAAGRAIVDLADTDIHGHRGVAMRDFPLDSGYGKSDYLH